MNFIFSAGAIIAMAIAPANSTALNLDSETVSYVPNCPYYHPVYGLTWAEAEEACEEWARENNQPDPNNPGPYPTTWPTCDPDNGCEEDY